MFHITDDLVDQHVSSDDAQRVLQEAFESFGRNEAAMQARIRTEAAGVKLSTLGAVIPGQAIAGAKVYTTIDGQFSFVIVIFSTEDGRPLASLDAGAITRLRTAACSVVAARKLARPDARVLSVYGLGTQGRSHVEQMSRAFDLDQVWVCDPHASVDEARALGEHCGVEVDLARPEAAIAEADIVVTASRSATPLFRGDAIRPGTFIAAIGSSLPHTRELDDTALTRARAIVVEWREQSLREAGDLVLAAPGVVQAGKVLELADVLTGKVTARQGPDDILIYKSVGVGLEDVALAGLAYQRIAAAQARAA